MSQRLRRDPAAARGFAIIALLILHPAAAEQVDVGDELDRLATTHGFNVKGIDHVDGVLARAKGEDLIPRLRRLLADFDHVIVQAPQGGVERVIILGAKIPYEPAAPTDQDTARGPAQTPTSSTTPPTATESAGAVSEIVLDTVRRGTQHAVKATLESDGGARVEQLLVIDTGADSVVLPASLIGRLGLSPGKLGQREMQTANGQVTARFGKIEALWLGESRIGDVEVAFVDDARLGQGLLGMSVLGRFKTTIDDEASTLTLRPR